MARGWESKAVENQQQEALTQPAPTTGPTPDPARQAERASLLLARTRALADLQLACAPGPSRRCWSRPSRPRRAAAPPLEAEPFSSYTCSKTARAGLPVARLMASAYNDTWRT